MELTNDEQQFLILRAQLAKTEHELQRLRESIKATFEARPDGITTTVYGGPPQPSLKPIELSLDLMKMKPGHFARVATNLDSLLTELNDQVVQWGHVSMALAELQGRVQMQVSVEFKE